MWSKLRGNVRAHKFRLKMCGASQYKPNRSKSTSRTFDRGRVFVKACPMLIARAHMQQLQQSQQLQQPEGWRFVPDTILPGYQWAHQWVPARTPTEHWGPISGKAVGGPNTVQHSSTVQKHGKHGSGELAARALLTRVYCVMTGHKNEEPNELMHEDFQVHVDSDWVGDLLERKNTTCVIVRRGIEERVSTTSENNVYNIHVKPMSISTCSSIQRC